jgi:hydrogenase maturation protein HypF
VDWRRQADGRGNRLMNTPHALRTSPLTRRRLRVRGLVQGVGFRPHVYRGASRFGIKGFVQNGPDGVIIEAEGAALEPFLDYLEKELPPLARIDTLLSADIPVLGSTSFEIRETAAGALASAAIPADTGLCEDCLEELFNPGDRRYLHPFVACTNCGPRYTMTRRLPYDRDATSMADFPLCKHCEQEYTDPGSRRFHAEPVCCHDCGPVLSHGVEQIADTLRGGGIVAIKGIGGFHLACDARNSAVIERLRHSKMRDGKPFAVMVLNTASASLFAEINTEEQALLEGPERPVVVLRSRRILPEALSPGLDTIGLFLPYTGLHYLLFHALCGAPTERGWLHGAQDVALVMTSANLSGNPLVHRNDDARSQLAGIADLVVDHDREISARADDSVARVAAGQRILIRRARGYVPNAIPLAQDGPTVLGTGAHLKNTVTLARGAQAWLSPHVGDLDTPATIAFQREAVDLLLAMMQTSPRAVACDWHRDYASTRLAEALAQEYDVPLFRVQHHHAHLAAVLASRGHKGPALGIALDGHGLGAGGESWGGELMLLTGHQFQRLGHFAPIPAPGGDAAAREPWRMAAGALHALGRGDEIGQRFADEPLAAALQALLSADSAGRTSAAGRLFDAAAGLLGISRRANFEGEPPMQMESLVEQTRSLEGGYRLDAGVLDFSPLLNTLADHPHPQAGAELFHGTLLDALAAWATQAAARTGIRTVALAGGCFLNRVLASQLPPMLEAAGLQPLLAANVPPNDGSISLGQAWIARRCLEADEEESN